ncbi:hypothetical protein QBC33DRAFT_461576 [Phialemonium atrogriseum]|uniref:Ras-GAP domain-containing protein n=1 Tax=Phialemonium atrogriseum TaxID=1093897 RepID=A0AAJ0FGH6_9PEZI|nr:uncharacterized protein QBC33DRAFT_461576 [Phialemonium atrogriseum]KAK1762358.1 hypothetical protein QBC33DRAFT_461576 [Phialemonium atrogriseum]
MEGRTFPLINDDVAPPLPERPVQDAAVFIAAGMPLAKERNSSSNARGPFRSNVTPPTTIRAVTPEPTDGTPSMSDTGTSVVPQVARGLGSMSAQTSPRSIPGAGRGVGSGVSGSLPTSRRQGVVFNDFAGSLDSSSSSPPPRLASHRPRTHTMDGAFRQQATVAFDSRQRVGSFSSSGSLAMNDDLRGPPLQLPIEIPYAATTRDRPSDLQIPGSMTSKERKKATAARSRLVKRASSRPTSPLISPPPSVDSLPLPIPTVNANKVLLLMKTLCGRMKGSVEYQGDPTGPWLSGTCYVDEEKGILMFDSGDMGPFHTPILPDLRGCRVLPVDRLDNGAQCLEVANLQLGIDVLLRPLVAEEFDLWLAALLCWQQLRPAGVKLSNGRAGNGPGHARTETKSRTSSSGGKDRSIIKIGRVMLWDKGLATSPRAIIKRPSTRDLRSSHTSWRRVSCMLQDDGEFKLMTDNDVTVLSVIELSQLARCAIQRLDKSVLDEEYCIGIFPVYASTSTQLSIFRPVYIALDSRILFEVWFVILRAFTVPCVYRIDHENGDQVCEVTDLSAEPTSDIFRMERKMTVRITEAKIRKAALSPELGVQDRHARGDQGGVVGNYLAEVMLDGEVRARTTTKLDTKNPFWREECEFIDLPPTIPCISVILKKVEGNLDNSNHPIQAPMSLLKSGSYVEAVCGSVDIPLHQTDRDKGHEQWLTIYDDKQQSIGTMLVKVQYEELIILFSKEYQPLSELLHSFSTGLTAQIAQALPGNLRRVAEVFLNIFQVSGSTTEWLMNLVEEEIDGIGNKASLKKPRFSTRLKSNESLDSVSDREQIVRDLGKSLAGEANLLFRGNSLLTQALEFHLRRLGKEYLEDILSDKIQEMNELNPNCEVDPSKLQHGDDLQQHWTRLNNFTNEVWDCISSSADRVPPELRHILKYIRAVAEDRYGDFLRTVAYTSVSGFLFLRFICPAILNPKLFGLLRDHPRPGAQRTLTLIAKGLQALANLSTIGKKETWMEPMNRFLNTQRQSLKDYLDDICAIPMERTNVILPASYSTPVTILGRLSPVGREGFPSLPYLIDHARNFAALVKLWMDENSISSANAHSYEGGVLEFHALCAEIQKRADECHARMEGLRLADAPSLPQLPEVDRLVLTDAMEQVSLHDALSATPSSFGSVSATARMDYDVGGKLRPPGSSGTGSDIDVAGGGGGGFHGSSHHNSGSSSREPRRGREQAGPSPQQRAAGLRNGKQARKFLSGFIRKSRTASPDALAAYSASATRERDFYYPLERDADRAEEGGGDRGRQGQGQGQEQGQGRGQGQGQ